MAQYDVQRKTLNQKSSSSNPSTRNVQVRSNSVAGILQMAKINPQMLTHNEVMVLQKTIGNGATCKLINNAGDQQNETVQKKENNTGLPDNLKAGVENLSGIDMSNVRVSYNSDKPNKIGALAYTQGTDIHVAPGQEKHLPHEAWHVVQQAQGKVNPTMQMKDVAVNDDVGLEREADEMGEKLLQMKSKERNADKFNVQPLQNFSGNLVSSTLLKKQNISSIVQRKINFIEALPENIKQLIIAYNEQGEKTTITDRINCLSGVEHALYDWLINNKSSDMNDIEGIGNIRATIDSAKTERANIIADSVTVSKDHLKNGGIPIAGFDKLTEEEQQEVRAIWKGLVEGTDNIKISSDELDNEGMFLEEHEGFNLKVLLEFSRLLEGKFGRDLIKEINSSDKEVVIVPFHQVNTQGKSFAAGMTGNANSDELVRLDAPPEMDKQKYYKEVVMKDKGEEVRRKFFNELKRKEKEQLGIKVVDNGETIYYQFGTGSSVKVKMPSDLPDTSLYAESRSADEKENEIAAPVFITLGHELGHAMHMQQGTITKKTNIPNLFEDKIDKKAYDSDREEYINIEENENALRAEHRLGKRKGHGNIPFLQKEHMNQKINQWLNLLATLEELKKVDVYINKINELVEAMYTRMSLELTEPDELKRLKNLKKLNEDFTKFSNKIEKLEFEFSQKRLQKEYEDILFTFYKKKFSFETGLDIPSILLSLDIEIKDEKFSAQYAISNGKFDDFLRELPQRRKYYVTDDERISLKLKDIEEAPQANREDNAQFILMKQALDRFVTVSWIFPE